MNKRIDRIKKEVVPILQKAGVSRSSLFGSLVTGKFNKDSDIDVLVELPKGSSLLDLIRLKHQLEDELGKKVDLLTYKSISPYMKKYIDAEQVRIL